MAPTKKTNNIFTLTQKDKDSPFEMVPTELKELPAKVYGDLDIKVSKVLTTFNDRPSNLGVLCSGLKGNSKTVTCLKICKEAATIPKLLITEPFVGDKFKNHLHSLKGEHIIFIDEFEKIYNTTELQDEFLTILDGAFGGKKMFLFTSNSDKISKYLKNRPNRIFYHFKYDNLPEHIVNEILEKELVAKEFEGEIRDILIVLGTVSFDVLLNLIDEVNRFKESPRKLIKDLNIEVEQTSFRVTLLLNGKMHHANIDYNPLTVENFFIEYKDENSHWYQYFNEPVSNYTMYTYKGQFVYESPKNKLIFTPFKPFKFEI